MLGDSIIIPKLSELEIEQLKILRVLREFDKSYTTFDIIRLSKLFNIKFTKR